MRQSLDIDRDALELSIAEAESDGPCQSFHQMCQKATEVYNTLTGQGRHWGVIASRIKLWGMDTTTKPRKQKGPRKKRRSKTAALMIANVLAHLRGKEAKLVVDDVEVILRPVSQNRTHSSDRRIDDMFHL